MTEFEDLVNNLSLLKQEMQAMDKDIPEALDQMDHMERASLMEVLELTQQEIRDLIRDLEEKFPQLKERRNAQG